MKRLFETKDKKYAAEAIEMVSNSSIIKECYKIAEEYREKACRNLKTLPETASRQALYDLAEFVIKQGN